MVSNSTTTTTPTDLFEISRRRAVSVCLSVPALGSFGFCYLTSAMLPRRLPLPGSDGSPTDWAAVLALSVQMDPLRTGLTRWSGVLRAHVHALRCWRWGL